LDSSKSLELDFWINEAFHPNANTIKLNKPQASMVPLPDYIFDEIDKGVHFDVYSSKGKKYILHEHDNEDHP
jgi:hypothetical protein